MAIADDPREVIVMVFLWLFMLENEFLVVDGCLKDVVDEILEWVSEALLRDENDALWRLALLLPWWWCCLFVVDDDDGVPN